MADRAGMRGTAFVWSLIVTLMTTSSISALQPPRAATTSGDAQPVIEVAISDLRANPELFAGKVVKLGGQLDECSGFECAICPESMTMKNRDAEQCLELNFRPLIAGTGFGSSEQEQVFRFASVIMIAKFDPTCWTGSCRDRQTVLSDVQIVSVRSRRASRVGLWLSKTSPLTEIHGPVAAEIRAAADAAGWPQNLPTKAFQTSGEKPSQLICWTYLEREPGSWPDSFEGALYAKSKADFYECRPVRKVGGRMVMQITN